MEQKHKDILIEQRANLVDNLNMRDGLFTQMISRKMINSRMMRTMKNGKTEDQQAEELLDLLPKLGAGAFDNFCEALISDFQEPVVTEYLKPVKLVPSDTSSSTSDTGSAGCQETVPPLGSATSASDGGLVPRVSPVEVIDAGAGSLPGVAVREEYQHQLYRRSIEPGTIQGDREVFMAQKPPQMFTEGDMRQEAEYFFQNSLISGRTMPGAAYTALIDNKTMSIPEKEQYLSLISGAGGPHSPHKGRPWVEGSGQFKGQHIDQMVVSDSISALRHSKSSIDMSQSLNQYSKPSVFHPSLSTNDLEKISSYSPEKFAFERLDKMSPHASHLPQHGNNLTSMVQGRAFTSGDRESDYRGSPVKVIPRDCGSIAGEVSSIRYLERDCSEIPRYREVVQTGGQREMVALPRHVERIAFSGSPNGEGRVSAERQRLLEEEERVDACLITRITRADSVDTMNKRSLPEPEGPTSKRLRDDVESIPLLLRPDPVPSVVKVYDSVDNRVVSIPVLDPPRKQPAPAAVVVDHERETQKVKQGSLLGAMDDPEIDLTDGPINVNVELSTRSFYMAHYKNSYAMRNIPRGKALILNVNQVVGKSARRGTDIDRDNLHNLLCQLHFDVTVFNDEDGLTAKEMVLKLQDFSQHAGHRSGDCTIVCILSHGEENYIFGADGRKFELDAVFQLFDNTCCPLLRGKPKIFIIQACRGGALDRGVQYYPDEHDGSDARVRQVPSMSDMVICFPTQNGYYAWRNRDRGSWYVEALVQVFMKYAKSEDLCTMLNRVNLLVSKKVSHCPNLDMDQMSQMSEYKSTLRMPHLYFFPGIGGCPST